MSAGGLTPEAYSRLLLLFGEVAQHRRVPTFEEMRAAIGRPTTDSKSAKLPYRTVYVEARKYPDGAVSVPNGPWTVHEALPVAEQSDDLPANNRDALRDQIADIIINRQSESGYLKTFGCNHIADDIIALLESDEPYPVAPGEDDPTGPPTLEDAFAFSARLYAKNAHHAKRGIRLREQPIEDVLQHMREEVDELEDAQDDHLELADLLALCASYAARKAWAPAMLAEAMMDKMSLRFNEPRESR